MSCLSPSQIQHKPGKCDRAKELQPGREVRRRVFASVAAVDAPANVQQLAADLINRAGLGQGTLKPGKVTFARKPANAARVPFFNYLEVDLNPGVDCPRDSQKPHARRPKHKRRCPSAAGNLASVSTG